MLCRLRVVAHANGTVLITDTDGDMKPGGLQQPAVSKACVRSPIPL